MFGLGKEDLAKSADRVFYFEEEPRDTSRLAATTWLAQGRAESIAFAYPGSANFVSRSIAFS